jgi:hypothetical protein
MKNKLLSGNPSGWNPSAPDIETLKDDDTWNVNESIITLIKVVTDSSDWNLTLYCDSSSSGGIFDNIILTNSGEGDTIGSFSLPYVDHNNNRSIYVSYNDNTNHNHEAIISIYGVIATI